MENCTIYSHHLEFEKVVQIVKANLPKANIEFNDGGTEKSLIATIKGGLFSKNKSLAIRYRQRRDPSYKLEKIDCDLTKNLSGMVGFVESLPAKNEDVRSRFVRKIMSMNCEMPFIAEPEISPEFESILKKIVLELDGFIFAEPSGIFNQASGQHFVDKNLTLILDTGGNSNVEDVEVTVNAKYHDQPEAEYNAEQLEKRLRTQLR